MKINIFITALFVLTFFCIYPASAQLNLITPDKKAEITGASGTVHNLASDAGYDTSLGLADLIATIVRIVLAIIGTIFLVLTFIAGNDWMQAHGSEEKVKKSKDTIRNLVIGLCLILIAYALTYGLGGLLTKMLLTK